MIRKLSIALLAAAALSGCVSSGYGYRGGGAVGGDYYYGRGASYGVPYGYGGVGYGHGYGYGYSDPYYSYGGYGYPYYGYAPVYPYPGGRHDDEDAPRRVIVPNKRVSGFDYPPGATVFQADRRNVTVGGPTRAVPGNAGMRPSTNPRISGGPRTRAGVPLRQAAPASVMGRTVDRAPRMSAPVSRGAPAPRAAGGAANRIRDARP